MAKKLGKFLLLTTAAAAAYGTYQYLKKNKHTFATVKPEEDDVEDFYDFDDIDDETFDKPVHNDRSYISLDKKIDLSSAKETARGVMDTVMEKVATVAGKVADVTKSSIHNADNFVHHNKETAQTPETQTNDSQTEDTFTETILASDSEPIEKTEEFFDDEKGDMQEGWENL